MSDPSRIYITVHSQDVRRFLAQGFEVEGVQITMSRSILSDSEANHVASRLRIVAADEGGKVDD